MAGRFVKLVVPLNMDYIDRIYIFDDELVPVTHVAKMLGYEHFSGNEFVSDLIVKKPAREIPGQRKKNHQFIHLADVPKIMDFLGWDEPDFGKLGVKPKLPGKNQEAQLLDSSKQPPVCSKRDRESEESDQIQENSDHNLFIKEFAKRYLAEHPDQAQKIIMDTIVKKQFDQIIGKLNGSLF
jgi:hypothetical protein